MKIEYIKTPEDVLKFMEENIKYGYVDINGLEHINSLKNFRTLYKTRTIEETLKSGLGTCIEQVDLINFLLKRLNIQTKMFCTRIYEGEDFNNLEEEEHMHCFVLYYLDKKVYQLEHPNPELKGIHEYKNEKDAINTINQYYVKLAKGKSRPVTQFSYVPARLSFKEFNRYINGLDQIGGRQY